MIVMKKLSNYYLTNKCISFYCVLLFLIGTSFSSVVRSEDEAQEFFLDIVPGARKLKQLDEDLKSKIDSIKRKFSHTPADKDGFEFPSKESSIETANIEVYEADKGELRKELRKTLDQVLENRIMIKRSIENDIRVYFAVSVKKCRVAIESNNEIEARVNCSLAEKKILECSNGIEKRANDAADRLTALYSPEFGKEGDFSYSKISCERVIVGLEDPSKLLRDANYRLSDLSCFRHLHELELFLKTGSMPSRMGKDDATLDRYVAYIDRMCPRSISDEGRRLVKEGASHIQAGDANDASYGKPLRRSELISSKMITTSLEKAERDEVDRPAREEEKRSRKALALDEQRRQSAKIREETSPVPVEGKSGWSILSDVLDVVANTAQEIASSRAQHNSGAISAINRPTNSNYRASPQIAVVSQKTPLNSCFQLQGFRVEQPRQDDYCVLRHVVVNNCPGPVQVDYVNASTGESINWKQPNPVGRRDMVIDTGSCRRIRAQSVTTTARALY